MAKKLSDLTLSDLLAGACLLWAFAFCFLVGLEASVGMWWPYAAQNAALAALGFAGYYLLRRKTP